ncbi:MAG: serine hydrolase, partial [Acidimicrobiales bacterium]
MTAPEPAPGDRQVVALCLAGLDGAVREAVEPDRQFYAASTMKLAVLIEAYRRHDAGQLDLELEVPVRTTFTSVADGSSYVLDDDEVDHELAGRSGASMPVLQLIERMVTVSSNEATNLVLDLLDLGEVTATAHRLGATRTHVRRPIGDMVARAAGT